MCLKICERQDIQISYNILQLGFHEHSFFKDFLLAFKASCFLLVFMKIMADSLGVKQRLDTL